MKKKIVLPAGRLIKLSDNVFKGHHPNGINEGYVATGIILNKPTIGHSFRIGTFHTSTVTEIINEDTFKTLNSTYRIIYTEGVVTK